MTENEGLPKIRFTLSELAGSLGDFGTIIPLILAVALVSDVNHDIFFSSSGYGSYSPACITGSRSRSNR
jgi:hypothetical protein